MGGTIVPGALEKTIFPFGVGVGDVCGTPAPVKEANVGFCGGQLQAADPANEAERGPVASGLNLTRTEQASEKPSVWPVQLSDVIEKLVASGPVRETEIFGQPEKKLPQARKNWFSAELAPTGTEPKFWLFGLKARLHGGVGVGVPPQVYETVSIPM